MRRVFGIRWMLVACVCAAVGAARAEAEIAISANDAKPKLVDGAVIVDPERRSDNIVILDMIGAMPKVIAQVDNVPTSVVGPPTSVAITPDESLALISASTKIDPSDPKKIVPDNTLSVVDLRANPPAVIATLQAGMGAAGIPSTGRAPWPWWRTAATARSRSSPSRGRR